MSKSLLLAGLAGLGIYAITRNSSVAPTFGGYGGGRPVKGYGQALYEPSTGQWTWLTEPQPYVVDEYGRPLLAT